MANQTGAFGLRPVGHLLGLNWSAGIERCYIASGYGTALFIGDPVMLSNEADDKESTGKYMSVEKSAIVDGSIILGVIVGFEADPSGLDRIYNPSSTARWAQVVIDPFVIYEIRGDGGGTPTDLFPGQNAVMIQTAAGSTVTGLSGIHLDEGTTTAPSATQTNPLWIMSGGRQEDNELGDNMLWRVLINNHQLRAGATGDVLGVLAS
jgi:hypothetical protein